MSNDEQALTQFPKMSYSEQSSPTDEVALEPLVVPVLVEVVL
jgi:hypothetical protein